MVPPRARTALAVLLTALMLPLPTAFAAQPDYKLGDVAAQDVITPVPLLVLNPEATDALKQRVARQVPAIVRHTPHSAGEAESALRESIALARQNFLTSLQSALDGRPPAETDLGSPAFTRIIADVARTSPRDLPFEKLAPLWLRGESDQPLAQSLVQPLRDVMAQTIVNSKTDTPLAVNQTVRLVPVKNLNDAPTLAEIESPGPAMPASKMTSLWRAKRLVETSFPTEQEAMGRFAASFVRVNAALDLVMSDILCAKRIEGLTANDTYEAAQLIVRKGQTIDRKTLSALAVMREKSLIGTLQTKLAQENIVAGQIKNQTAWIAASLAAVCIALVLILRRVRPRPPSSLLPVLANQPLAGSEPHTLPDAADEHGWRGRAIVAERKAERAHDAIRSGVLDWMREKIFRTLFRHRSELLSVQQKAESEMRELEQRLEQLHTPLQQRIGAYEKRIRELEAELAAKGEENRQLIGARISVARQQLRTERERFGTN